jgi:hypothetical protein
MREKYRKEANRREHKGRIILRLQKLHRYVEDTISRDMDIQSCPSRVILEKNLWNYNLGYTRVGLCLFQLLLTS